MVRDTTVMTYDAIKSGKEVLFEGAQGTLLDLDMGTYPYVTSVSSGSRRLLHRFRCRPDCHQ